MRISGTKVAQLIESNPPTLVIIDESNGDEISLNADELEGVVKASLYFSREMHARRLG